MAKWRDAKTSKPKLTHKDKYEAMFDEPEIPFSYSDDVLVMCLTEDKEVQFLVAHFYECKTYGSRMWEMWCPGMEWAYLEEYGREVIMWMPIPKGWDKEDVWKDILQSK